jgi:hypothetical protein
MSPIQFDADLFTIGVWTLLRLPKSASAQLPSRGLTMVEGTLNGVPFQAALEPDGKGSHWFRVEDALRAAAGAEAGTTVTLALEPATEWMEPPVPADVQRARAADPPAQTQWRACTTLARWDWLRWINATAQPATRQRRIAVAFSKLKAGMRRPCCFNRNLCTEPYVSKNGVLLEPTEVPAVQASRTPGRIGGS